MKIKSIILILLAGALLSFSFAFPESIKRSLSANAREAVKPATAIPVSRSAYDSLHLDLSGLNREAFDYAVKGIQKLKASGQLLNETIVTIVDFSQPSYKKRLYIVDLKNYHVLFNTWVAHGKNSGREWANSFSNTLSSFKSSPGFYITGETYNGSNGYSLKLNGMEKGINDRANERAIVVHGADYVSQNFISDRGYIGRSYGCPAVPLRQAQPIINAIKNGTCFFIYNPDESYTRHSQMLG